MIEAQTENLIERLAAGQIIAASLASALADPRSPLAERCHGAGMEIVAYAWDFLAAGVEQQSQRTLGIGERLPIDADPIALVEWLALSSADRERAHQRVFGLVVSKLCPAYETEYCASKDTTQRSQELADIAGFYRAFGLRISRDTPERPDHISLEIEYIALLNEKQRCALLSGDAYHAAICSDARTSFVRDHAAWWMPTFGRLLEKRAMNLHPACERDAKHLVLLAGVARLLCAWVAAERMLCSVEPCRRIVNPSVAPQESEDSCGSCTVCPEQGAHA